MILTEREQQEIIMFIRGELGRNDTPGWLLDLVDQRDEARRWARRIWIDKLRSDLEIVRLRDENARLRAELEALRKSAVYTITGKWPQEAPGQK